MSHVFNTHNINEAQKLPNKEVLADYCEFEMAPTNGCKLHASLAAHKLLFIRTL